MFQKKGPKFTNMGYKFAKFSWRENRTMTATELVDGRLAVVISDLYAVGGTVFGAFPTYVKDSFY